MPRFWTLWKRWRATLRNHSHFMRSMSRRSWLRKLWMEIVKRMPIVMTTMAMTKNQLSPNPNHGKKRLLSHRSLMGNPIGNMVKFELCSYRPRKNLGSPTKRQPNSGMRAMRKPSSCRWFPWVNWKNGGFWSVVLRKTRGLKSWKAQPEWAR